MPIFEYRCSKCEEIFELLVLRNSPAPACPRCGTSDAVERLISLSSVSSEGSREHAMNRARKRAGAVRFEKDFYEHKAEHDHHH